MMRPILAAGSVAFALVASPAIAQQSPTPNPPTQQTPAPNPPAQQGPTPNAPAQPSPMPNPPAEQRADPSLVGLAVYSSDGQKVGEVTEVGMAGGTPAVRVEMGQFLGLGSSSVLVNANALERKADRVEISMTADEIKDTISKQRKEQQ